MLNDLHTNNPYHIILEDINDYFSLCVKGNCLGFLWLTVVASVDKFSVVV